MSYQELPVFIDLRQLKLLPVGLKVLEYFYFYLWVPAGGYLAGVEMLSKKGGYAADFAFSGVRFFISLIGRLAGGGGWCRWELVIPSGWGWGMVTAGYEFREEM